VSSLGGHIVNCFATGNVSAHYARDVGGLVGSSEGALTHCHWQGDVMGWENVGGLAGIHEEDIRDCSAAGNIQGVDRVGGLIGYNDEGGLFTSKAVCVVQGHSFVGGLVGSGGEQYVYDCYALGQVIGEDYVGGLAGSHDEDSSLRRCFSAATVEGAGDFVGGLIGMTNRVIRDSFWDVEASGVTNACGSHANNRCDDSFGRLTTQMQTAATFLDAGWDFVDETMNGTADIWKISEVLDYPRLWWEPHN
jgi:hypothetical protein